ncbi:MAG: hypothetical protein IKE52_05400 [Mogibacterium sp.]|nr:hypothetical protein [Mogibacterium sp.]
MIEIVFKTYCNLINLIKRVSDAMSGRLKSTLFDVSVLVMTFICTIHYFNDRLESLLHSGTNMVFRLSPIIFLIILICCIEEKADHEKIKINKIFWAGWFLCFITIFVMSFINPVKKLYFLWSLLSLTILPMIMIVLSQSKSYFKWSVKIARNVVTISYIFVVMNLAITPFVANDLVGVETIDYNYLGLCVNPNGNGMICTTFFTAALYLLLVEDREGWWNLVSMGFSAAIVLISGCRTAQIVMLAELIIAASVYKVHSKEHKRKWKASHIAIACILVAMLSAALAQALIYLDKMDVNAYALSEPELSDYDDTILWVYENETRIKINDLSSGRLLIWKAYSRNLSLFGKGKTNAPLMPEVTASRWAHNNALDIWYISGVFAFLGYIIWLAAVTAFAFKCLSTKGQYRKEYLLTILAFAAYFIQAMLEITLYPMSVGFFFMLSMALGTAAFKPQDEQQILTGE